MNRRVFEKTGGLLDEDVLGGCDSLTAYSFIQKVDIFLERYTNYNISSDYFQRVFNYQLICKENKFKTSFLNDTVLHNWHGSWESRKYHDRYEIYRKHGYNPSTDLIRNNEGLISLSKQGERLENDLKKFFCKSC